MMHPWMGVALGVFAWALAAVPAAAGECPAPRRAVAVALDTRYGEVVYHTRYDSAELDQLRRRGKGFGQWQGWRPTGLTLTEIAFRMRIEMVIQPLGQDRYCAALTKVDAVLGHDVFDVYVASRYRPGSCAYRSILAHENSHVAIFRDVLERRAGEMRRRLAEAAERLGAIRVSTPAAAAGQLQERLRRQVTPLFHEIARAQDEANARLDTPENYRAENAACPDW